MSVPAPETIDAPDGTRLTALRWDAAADAPGLVIVHGAGSRKDSHTEFAALAHASGLTVLALDLRGHGESDGEPGPGFLDDVMAAVDRLAALGAPCVGIRGSSLGGFLALHAAARHDAVRAVAAICPARSVSLARRYSADWPHALSLSDAVRREGVARGFWHATRDELVPWGHSFDLYQRSPHPRSLRVVLGGDHRALQAQARIHRETIAFLTEHLA